jgi:hypothetical protein
MTITELIKINKILYTTNSRKWCKFYIVKRFSNIKIYICTHKCHLQTEKI